MSNNQNFPTMDARKERLVREYGNHFATGDEPAVYVGTYGKYNEGSLFGEWVDITSFNDYDSFIEYCRELHSDEEDPELMFQDFENFPRVWYEESGFDEDVFDMIIQYHEADDPDAIDAYLRCTGAKDISDFEDRYLGHWDSKEDFAWHIFEECYADTLPEFARRYFDIEAFARDLFLDYFEEDGYVFNPC